MNIDQAKEIQDNCEILKKGGPPRGAKEDHDFLALSGEKVKCQGCVLFAPVKYNSVFAAGAGQTVCFAFYGWREFRKIIENSVKDVVLFNIDKFCEDLAEMGGSDGESKEI